MQLALKVLFLGTALRELGAREQSPLGLSRNFKLCFTFFVLKASIVLESTKGRCRGKSRR